jgi:hypothetical protein
MPLMLLLRAVPAWAWGGVALLVLAGVWHWGEVRQARDEGRAEIRAEWDAMNERQRVAADKARADRDEITRQREAAARKEIDDATLAVDRARADADSARRAAAGLRDAARAAARHCGAPRHTAAAASGAATPNPGDVLADVLGLVEQAGRDMAQEADRRGIAGATCERLYESITTTLKGHAP